MPINFVNIDLIRKCYEVMQSRHSKGHFKKRIVEIGALVKILQQSATTSSRYRICSNKRPVFNKRPSPIAAHTFTQ